MTKIRATETAGVSSQGGLAQGRGVQESQDPGTRGICRKYWDGEHTGWPSRAEGQSPPPRPQGAWLTPSTIRVDTVDSAGELSPGEPLWVKCYPFSWQTVEGPRGGEGPARGGEHSVGLVSICTVGG